MSTKKAVQTNGPMVSSKYMKPMRHTYSKERSCQTITVDDVANLALKIGTEIWGEKHFLELMGVSNNPSQPTAHLTIKPGVA